MGRGLGGGNRMSGWGRTLHKWSANMTLDKVALKGDPVGNGRGGLCDYPVGRAFLPAM